MKNTIPNTGTNRTSRHQATAEMGSRLTVRTQKMVAACRARSSRASDPVMPGQSVSAKGGMCYNRLVGKHLGAGRTGEACNRFETIGFRPASKTVFAQPPSQGKILTIPPLRLGAL